MKAAAGGVRDEVVAAVVEEPRAVAAAGTATRVEVTDAEEAAAAPGVPAVVATAAAADFMDAVGDATGEATSGRKECNAKETDFLAKCARCLAFGHEESICSSDAVVLAMELPILEEDRAVGAQAFVAKETGNCRVMVGEEVRGGELGKQVVQYITERCNRRGHTREVSTTKESDFFAKCARCSSFGHEKSTISSDAMVLPMELPMSQEDLAVGAQAFMAKEIYNYRVMVWEEVEGEKLGK